jgi:cell division protease FtsH
MGGRAAEELVLGDPTTGAGNDLDRATELARRMVSNWGMSEKLGRITFGKKEETIFLGREITNPRDFSDQTAEIIDAEVRRIVEEAYETSLNLLRDNMDTLHSMAEALLDREILDGEQIRKIVNGESLDKSDNKETDAEPDSKESGSEEAGSEEAGSEEAGSEEAGSEESNDTEQRGEV